MKRMDEHKNLLVIADRLRAAALKRDWNSLTELDRELNTLVSSLIAKTAWSAKEHSALQLVRRAHAAAIAILNAESEHVAEQLVKLANGRAGWEAYARCSEGEGDQIW